MRSTPKIEASAFIHPTADVAAAGLGAETRVLQFVVIESGAMVGDHCQIDPHCLVMSQVSIGDRVTIGGSAVLATGVAVGADVTIGPNCVIGGAGTAKSATLLREGATLGANVTVMAGVEVGQYSRIEAGSVVAGNVPPGATVIGNPAVMREGPLHLNDVVKPRLARESAIAGVRFLSLQEVQDMRGTLTVCQWDRQLPFAPRRVFFLHGVPNENVRGAHAHKECCQVLVCFNGSVNVLVDDGQLREEHVLDSSAVGLLIPAGIWATQYRYSPTALLVVFASHDYDAADYIRNYAGFLEYRRTSLDTAA